MTTDQLTPAEREVLEASASGMTIDEIAADRGRSRWTIRDQRRAIMKKTGARNITHAVALVAEGKRSMISTGQLGAFHAKADALDRALGRPRRKSKEIALELASREFRRPIGSASELAREEASRLLDWLDEQLAKAGA
jgi:DNA-binding CsgD family transcriptional regulator